MILFDLSVATGVLAVANEATEGHFLPEDFASVGTTTTYPEKPQPKPTPTPTPTPVPK